MVKKIISMILVFAMLLSAAPQNTVYAEEGAGFDWSNITDKEAALAEAKRLVEAKEAVPLTAENWIAESTGNKGDLVWTTASADMAGKLTVQPADVTDQAFEKAIRIKTTQKASNNWDAQAFFRMDGTIKKDDRIFFAFRIRGISNETDADAGEVKANIRIRTDNDKTDAADNINVNDVVHASAFPIGTDYTLYCGTAPAPTDSNAFGSVVFQVGMAAEEFEIADLYVVNLSRTPASTDEEPGTEPGTGDEGEKALAAAAAQYQAGTASLLTAEEWNAVGSKGDNCWVDANGSMTSADVTALAGTDVDYGKTLTISTTKKADLNYNGQIFFKLSGKVKTGDRLFYAFRMKGIRNETAQGEVVTNMRIRPSNGGDAAVNFTRDNIKDTIDDAWTLVWGYADAPANSADSDSMDSMGNKYGAFVLQVGMAQEEFAIADLQIYNLDSTPGEMDDPEEEVERKSFEEVMQMYQDGTGTLVTYPNLTDEHAYELEWQEPLEDNGEDFVVTPVDVAGQDFSKALHIKTMKTGDQAWDAQLYFNLDHTKAIKKGDTLFFGCKVRGISSVTNKEAMFVTANTRIRPDRSSSSNFDITSSINADDETAWTQIYGGCAAAAASNDTDGAWVFQLGSAIQELEIADVFVINFGNALSEKEMPVMTRSYLGMEEDAQWRKDALERIEQIRKQDISVKLVDGSGNPIQDAAVSVEQTRHEFGFGTIVNVDEYEKWDAAKQEKFKTAFRQIAHNRAGFENALKHYYVTDPTRQEWIDQWMDYFESQDIDIRGHVLVYGSDDRLRNVDSNGVSTDMENKALLTSDTEEGKAALSEWTKHHIETYVNKYKGRIYNWDVVNENMTSHDWSDRLGGYDAIVNWFEQAHEADPDIKLTYNDYGILSRDKGHQDYHYELCKYLVEHDAPLTTIGIQGHVSLISPIEIIHILDRFSELGKDIEITEFTYEDDDPQFQAQFTRDFMIAVFSEEAVSSITTWGFYQGCMYQPKAAMVDNNFNFKPNGEVWRDMIYNQWWTSEEGATDTEGMYRLRAFKGNHEITVKVGDTEQTFDITLSDKPVTLNLVCVDGEIKESEQEPGHVHTLTSVAAKASTCTEAGNSAYFSCTECGKYFADKDAETEIEENSWVLNAGHTLTHVAEQVPSGTQAGNKEYFSCSVCGKYFADEKAETEIEKDSWILAPDTGDKDPGNTDKPAGGAASAESVKNLIDTVTSAGTAYKQADYTPESWNAFTAALEAAQKVMADANATQAQVDAAQKNLTEAIAKLAKQQTEPPKPPTVKKSTLTLGVKETSNIYKKGYTYTTSNKKYVTVSKKGVIKGVRVGKATVTVKNASGQKIQTYTVTVKKAPNKISKVSPTKKTLKKGKSCTIKVTLPKGTASKITFTSSNKKVATVSAKGVVKAKKKGQTTITVKTFNKKSKKVKITVK